AVRDLLPVQQHSQVLSQVKTELNQLETLYEGVFLLNELSNRTRHVISGFGESMAALILNAYFKSLWVNVQPVDTRELIVCTNSNEKVKVNYDRTYENMARFFETHSAELFVAPGFISRNDHGIPSTLGRGGSDFTAALFASFLDAQS